MSDKKQEVETVEAEYETVNQDHAETASEKTRSSSGVPATLAFLALVVALGSAAASYYIFDQMNKKESSSQSLVQETTSQLKQDVQRFQNTFQSKVDQLDAQIAQTNQDSVESTKEILKIKNTQDALQNTIEKMKADLGRTESGWKTAEVEYLLNIANHRLILEKDINTAVAALSSADKKLLELSEPALLPVREKIHSEIVALKSLNQLDRSGIVMRIRGLSDQVEQLKVKGAQYVRQPNDVTVQDNKVEPDLWNSDLPWKEKLVKAWEQIRTSSADLIRIHDHRVEPMLAPEKEYFLYKGMALKLEGAQLALLKGDELAFRANVKSLEEWLNNYFDTQDAVAMNMQKELAEFSQLKIETTLPDISGSLRLLMQKSNELDLPNNNGAVR